VVKALVNRQSGEFEQPKNSLPPFRGTRSCVEQRVAPGSFLRAVSAAIGRGKWLRSMASIERSAVAGLTAQTRHPPGESRETRQHGTQRGFNESSRCAPHLQLSSVQT
jgi:hypothetical protein